MRGSLVILTVERRLHNVFQWDFTHSLGQPIAGVEARQRGDSRYGFKPHSIRVHLHDEYVRFCTWMDENNLSASLATQFPV